MATVAIGSSHKGLLSWQPLVRFVLLKKNNADEIKGQLENTIVKIEAKVGAENRIFGAITAQQVSLALALQGFKIDRRIITINEEIKILGEYTATVKLHADVHAQLAVHVVPADSHA